MEPDFTTYTKEELIKHIKTVSKNIDKMIKYEEQLESKLQAIKDKLIETNKKMGNIFEYQSVVKNNQELLKMLEE